MLRDQQGIRSIKVALLAERGVIEYDPAHWTVDKLVGVRVCGCHHFIGQLTQVLISRKFPTLASTQRQYHKDEKM